MTVAQKVLLAALSPPRTPVLSKTFKRPFTAVRIWVGPMSPIVSGGMNPVSVPSSIVWKLVLGVCGARS